MRWVIDHPETQSYDWILNHHLGDRDADHWLRACRHSPSFIDVSAAIAIPWSWDHLANQGERGNYAKSLDAWYAPNGWTRSAPTAPLEDGRRSTACRPAEGLR
jgi:hypothetical protein